MSELDVTLAGKSLSDYTNTQLRLALGAVLYTNTAEMWQKYLNQQGYTGSVSDMLQRYYVDRNVPKQFRNYISAGIYLNASPSVPNFASVSSLLHFDGADGSTTFTDVKGNTWTRTGTPTISTVQSKFGGASGAFSGGTQYIETPSSTAFSFGPDNFTVEGWFRPTSSDASNYRPLITRDNVSGTRGWLMFTDLTTGNLTFTAWNGGTNKTVSSSGNFLANYLNTWVHVAVSRVGDNMRLFVDGVLANSVDVTGFSVADNSETVRIASLKNAGGADPFFIGYVDDVRIVKQGIYTTNFTPPASAFPDS